MKRWRATTVSGTATPAAPSRITLTKNLIGF
jgi:hypothetical protein